MSARRSPLVRFLKSWGAFIMVVLIGIAFMGALIHGIVKGNETAHNLDHGNRLLDAHLVELADVRGTASIATLPFAAGDTNWTIVCYVDAGHWVGKAVADRLGLDVRDFSFDPRNIYVVEKYWGLAFFDSETSHMRIVEVHREPVARIEGPECLSRVGAEVTARPLGDDSGDIVVSFVGTQATL